MALENQPILIRKLVEEGGHDQHGGAWKVAYADFVTAMMAFFLLLWLLSTSTEETLKGLAEFFSDAQQNRGEPGGVGGVLEGITVTPFEPIRPQTSSPLSYQITLPTAPQTEDTEPTFELDLMGDRADAAAQAGAGEVDRFEAAREAQQFHSAEEAIRQALEASPELRAYRDNIRIERTPEGLRIQIVDQERVPMFPVGSDRMYPAMRKLLEVVAKAVRDLPNRLSIRGHTDARPYAPGGDMDNWKLSADRANASRKVLIEAGLPPERIQEVVGRADTEPLIAEDPMDARNRRISIVLRTHAAGDGSLPDKERPGSAAADARAALLPDATGGSGEPTTRQPTAPATGAAKPQP